MKLRMTTLESQVDRNAKRTPSMNLNWRDPSTMMTSYSQIVENHQLRFCDGQSVSQRNWRLPKAPLSTSGRVAALEHVV
jgi:hypothetical protein